LVFVEPRESHSPEADDPHAGPGLPGRAPLSQAGKLFITCRQQSDFEDFARKNVASEATLYLKTEPVLLDNFLKQLKGLDGKKRDDAYLETI
jgi:hypothetical protein